MFPSKRLCQSALLLACLSASACAGTVPSGLVGEWLQGAQYPESVYTSDPAQAGANSSRLVLNPDSTYRLTRIQVSAIPGYFGSLLIACESADVTDERGTYAVEGNKMTLKPAAVQKTAGLSPARLNGGCKRFAGVTRTQTAAAESATWQVNGSTLALTFGQDRSAFERRKAPAPAASAASLPAELRGEWHSGRISPIEYYNVATGKWAEASGTSVILKLGADFTYQRTGLLVVTTYGCTSKLLVQEQGKVTQSGSTLTFTPTTSSSTGYTCSPSKVLSQKNGVKPYSERAQVRVEASGQHVLSLTSASGETLFNRPLGSAPESAPATGQGTPTPPAPGQSANAAPSVPSSSKWTARGDWDAVITTAEGTVQVRFSMDDDQPRILGSGFSGTDVVGWIQGNSATGALKIGLEVGDDREVELNVTGQFDGNTYRGRFTTTNASGDTLSGGTLTMTRR